MDKRLILARMPELSDWSEDERELLLQRFETLRAEHYPPGSLRFVGDEPIWYLRSLPYSQTGTTRHWRHLRQWILEHRDATCQVCGFAKVDNPLDASNDFGPPPLNLHHLTYARVGAERSEDLLLTCSPCNYSISKPLAPSSRYWFGCPEGSRVPLAEKQARLRLLQRLERLQREDGQLENVSAVWVVFQADIRVTLTPHHPHLRPVDDLVGSSWRSVD